ncbi:hypothetical protein C0J52_16866 [Blattella germanica]|nr:hypothetical protein C0J52_16866 [Blattella germanica]
MRRPEYSDIVAALIALMGGCLYYIFDSVKRLPQKKLLIEFVELDVANSLIVTHTYLPLLIKTLTRLLLTAFSLFIFNTKQCGSYAKR